MGDLHDDIAAVREVVDHARSLIARTVPPGRAQSLALTKLDEARLWAMEGLSVAAQEQVASTLNGHLH